MAEADEAVVLERANFTALVGADAAKGPDGALHVDDQHIGRVDMQEAARIGHLSGFASGQIQKNRVSFNGNTAAWRGRGIVVVLHATVAVASAQRQKEGNKGERAPGGLQKNAA